MQLTTILLAAFPALAMSQVCISGVFTGVSGSNGCTYSLDVTVTDDGNTVCSGSATGGFPHWSGNCNVGQATVSSSQGTFTGTYTDANGVQTVRFLTESTPPFGRDCTVQPWTAIPECA